MLLISHYNSMKSFEVLEVGFAVDGSNSNFLHGGVWHKFQISIFKGHLNIRLNIILIFVNRCFGYFQASAVPAAGTDL